jgi:pimeloyl-ACP methyl ester carboxylesterase
MAVVRESRGRSGLSWSEAGDGLGPAIVYFHGTEKRRDGLPFPDAAERAGVRLLMADRPGYGTSEARPGATFGDITRMLIADLDEQAVDRFSVLGYSGGGPHAIACAFTAPLRVGATGLLASWAPMQPPDPGLPAGVRFAMRLAARLPRPAVQLMLALGRSSSAGMVDDVCRVARPWGFGVEEVSASVRMIAWHAAGDPQVPIAPWRAVDGVELNVVAGRSHEISRDVWTTALQTLGEGAPPG